MLVKIIEKFKEDRNMFTLREIEEVDQDHGTEKGKGIQNRVLDDFEHILRKPHNEIAKMRQGAIEKYGHGNHTHIDHQNNICRSIRHLYATFTYKTDVGGDEILDLTHAMVRLMMASDRIMSKYLIDSPIYEDIKDSLQLYEDMKDINCPNLTMFPSVYRRMMMISHMMKEEDIVVDDVHLFIDEVIKLLVYYVRIDNYQLLNFIVILCATVLYKCIDKIE